MITFGMPNLQTTFFHTKLVILASVIVTIGSASTHFVKESITMMRNLNGFLPMASGPIMFVMPQFD